jgi:lysophospholipase L1-like esterase
MKNWLGVVLIMIVAQGCAPDRANVATTKPSATAPAPAEPADWVSRSQLSDGDFSRLWRVMEKAKRGQPVTVAVIGGSITEGARASSADKTYGRLVYRWWQEAFPNSTVTFFNAGVGATGSMYGSLRAPHDLLSHQPDFVIEEWAVNDGDSERSAETVEGLTRQILSQANRPAIMLLFMMHQDGRNAQQWQSKVGRHYALPMVSYRDVFWPEMQSGRLTWQDISPDSIHPNDRGHAAAAQFVIQMLETAKASIPTSAVPDIQPLPAPMISDRYARTSLQAGADLKPLTNSGWTPVKNGWQTQTPGSTIEFEITGRRIYISWYRFRGAMGKAKVQLDGGKPLVLDGWFPGTWGGYRDIRPIGIDLPAGAHRVRVELLPEKNPESTGHEFRVVAIGAADIDAPADATK